MNFFQAQDNARRKTWQLGAMFAAAVLTLVVLTNLLVALAFSWGGQQAGMTFSQTLAQLPADTWFWVSGGVLGIVATASAYKYFSISAGGRAIAESLGGSLIHQNTRNSQQRQLLNVVEEMAIAAGLPVPPVYLIPESSINAFAAGFGTDDAVIGINQGTLDHLNRRELQGVIAHEFSHILNGDTNINLRLIAILHGILFIGMIGYGLMRAGGYSRRDGLPVIAVAVGLLVIGYGGTFFGNLIKAAVSRQREYLADASAVQFTREPDGIADALKKIGGHAYGSTLENPAAEEASHMFFGAAAHKFASSMMATHPPLDRRILAIQPNWDGKFPIVTNEMPSRAPGHAGAAGFAGGTSGQGANDAGPRFRSTPESIAAHVGTPTEASLVAARALIDDNDDVLNTAAHDPYEARALVYAMLIDRDGDLAEAQLRLIRENADTSVPDHVVRLLPLVMQTDAPHLLTLLELASPALKELSYPQYKRFTQIAAALITADKRVEVFEWVLHRLLIKELYAHFEGPQSSHGRIKKISKVADSASCLLSILAAAGNQEVHAQITAYEAGAAEIGIELPYRMQEEFNFERLNDALNKLRKLRPLAKPALIKACAATALADNRISTAENALLQGIAAVLDCPLPANIHLQTAASQPSAR